MPKTPKSSIAFTYGSEFLIDHAGRLLKDSQIALVEVISNAWDAGANVVKITWPKIEKSMDAAPDEEIVIEDDGTGMTIAEFQDRWMTWNYSRVSKQGREVIFPAGNATSPRKAHGRNGKGRHSMFCFADLYTVETWKNGECSRWHVRWVKGMAKLPVQVTREKLAPRDGHGTILSCRLVRGALSVSDVSKLLSTKFALDPAFKIMVNDQPIDFTDLNTGHSKTLHVKDVGDVIVFRVQSPVVGRASTQHGIAWWVNKKLIDTPSWKHGDEQQMAIDRRLAEARSYSFIVKADVLEDHVETDWTGFKDSPAVEKVRIEVRDYINREIQRLFSAELLAQKKKALSNHGRELRELSNGSRYFINEFIDIAQRERPTLSNKDLDYMLTVLTQMERSRSGTDLLRQLAHLSSSELDQLHTLLEKWSVREAYLVLDELDRRLKLIEALEERVGNPTTDELHEIHPLFENGLWIFGPEYESVHFQSNRTLATVVRDLLGDDKAKLSDPRKRADFVALPDGSLGFYASERFGSLDQSVDPEVVGFDHIFILELKRGGFKIGREERMQAANYASILRESGKIQEYTKIVCYVLGCEVKSNARDVIQEGNTTIFAAPYEVIIRRAHARTFRLKDKIQKLNKDVFADTSIHVEPVTVTDPA
jgi:hypothetical protein